MIEAHALVGRVTIVLGLVAVIWSVALIVTRREPGPLFLGNLVWVFLAVAVAAVLGAATFASGRAAPLGSAHSNRSPQRWQHASSSTAQRTLVQPQRHFLSLEPGAGPAPATPAAAAASKES